MTQDDNYFPGKDYPDRNKWLNIRDAQRVKPKPKLAYNPLPRDDKGRRLQPKAFFVGTNAAKKGVKQAEDPRKAHQTLVRLRHAAYRRTGR